ncbi:unnamed protein product [Linum tenue]|uniref:Membrane magnesium transporter n=1 Tax=Linum tenue TaxID=586396 RepID=A0AAV0LF00_9ROSI|nr:unnamed protein product [Linum tenue]
MGLGFTVGVIGVLILGHAAYSTIQCKPIILLRSFNCPKAAMQVVLELLVGLLFCMWAALTVPGKFLSVHPHSDENRYVSLCVRLRYSQIYCVVDFTGNTYVTLVRLTVSCLLCI